MTRFAKAAFLSLGLAGAALAGGCTSGYYDDDGYYHGSDHRYHDSYYSRDSGWRDSDRDRERVRVCDADGDDCHWEYRRR